MLKLQGVRIEGYRSFHEYFNFPEIYALLCSEDAYIFRDFLENNNIFSASNHALQRLRGVKRTDGRKSRNTGDLRYVEDPKLCADAVLVLEPVFVRNISDEIDDQRVLRLRNMDAFVNELNLFFQLSFQELYPLEYNSYCTSEDWDELKRSIHSAVSVATENGTRCFTYKAATELYIYFLLHVLAAVKPNNQVSLDALKHDLDKLCGTTVSSAAHETCISLVPEETNPAYISLVAEESNSACVPLEYYDGKAKTDDTLSVMELKNNTESDLAVYIKDTVLLRQLRAGESIYVLRKGAKFVSFIPRFRLNDNVSTYLWDGHIYEKCNNVSNVIYSDIEQPVSWVRNAEYGTFIVDLAGNLDAENAWPEVIPGKPIVAVDAYAQNYAMLLNDGTLTHNLPSGLFKEKRLLTISLGMNSVAGIDQERNVLFSSGKVLHDIAAVDVKVYGNHFICLLPNGNVFADSKLVADSTAYGIAISSRGYILAHKDMIAMYNFRNEFERYWNVSNITEIEADEYGLAYYNGFTGEVETLSY